MPNNSHSQSVPIGAGLLAVARVPSPRRPRRRPPQRRLRRRDQSLLAADARRRAEDLPLRHVRQRGVLGRRAAAAQGDRRREERRRRPGRQRRRPRSSRRPQGRRRRAARRRCRSRSRPARSTSTTRRRPSRCSSSTRSSASRAVRPTSGVNVDGHPVRALPLDRRRFVRAGHRQAPRRLGQPRPQRRRDRLARAEPASRSPTCWASTTRP